jgi:hypothetical protein
LAVDYYPDEEGVLLDGISLGWCIASTTIDANQQVAFDTATAGNVVALAGAYRDSCGVAMRAASSSDYVPVLLYGIVKMKLAITVAAGSPVQSATAAGYVYPAASIATATYLSYMKALCYGGTVHILGKALQGGLTDDEVLILVSPL